MGFIVDHDVPRAMTLQEIHTATQSDPCLMSVIAAARTGQWHTLLEQTADRWYPHPCLTEWLALLMKVTGGGKDKETLKGKSVVPRYRPKDRRLHQNLSCLPGRDKHNTVSRTTPGDSPPNCTMDWGECGFLLIAKCRVLTCSDGRLLKVPSGGEGVHHICKSCYTKARQHVLVIWHPRSCQEWQWSSFQFWGLLQVCYIPRFPPQKDNSSLAPNTWGGWAFIWRRWKRQLPHLNAKTVNRNWIASWEHTEQPHTAPLGNHLPQQSLVERCEQHYPESKTQFQTSWWEPKTHKQKRRLKGITTNTSVAHPLLWKWETMCWWKDCDQRTNSSQFSIRIRSKSLQQKEQWSLLNGGKQVVTRNISHFKQVSPTLGPTATLGEDNSTQRETEPNDFVHNDELNPTARQAQWPQAPLATQEGSPWSGQSTLMILCHNLTLS